MKNNTADLKLRLAARARFFRSLGPSGETLVRAIGLIPGIFSSVVDTGMRIMAFSRSNLENCNVAREEDVVGKRLHDIFPKVLADIYAGRHREVQGNGEPVLLRDYEYAGDLSTDRRTVSMIPLRGTRGKVVGSLNISWSAGAGPASEDRYGAVRDAVAWIDAHFTEKITDATLAGISRMGVPAFRRAFAKVVCMTPAAYVRTVRVNHARKLLETTGKTIEEIAFDCNFCDVSHFVKVFAKMRGTTPGEYRRRHVSAL